MSILIKMEMPKRCADCPFIGWAIRVQKEISQLEDYASCKVTRREISADVDTGKPHDCPLIELPPHGRLIDADAFGKDLRETIDECFKWAEEVKEGEMYARVSQSLATFVECSLRAKAAPTIIEAEEGEE